MRIVIDTNVIVSGIFWSGIPGKVLERWAEGSFILCTTTEILNEYFEVIDRLAAKCERHDLAVRWKTYFFKHTALAESTYRFLEFRDPNDAKFVECAMSANANIIVSGDNDLLSHTQVEGQNHVPC